MMTLSSHRRRASSQARSSGAGGRRAERKPLKVCSCGNYSIEFVQTSWPLGRLPTARRRRPSRTGEFSFQTVDRLAFRLSSSAAWSFSLSIESRRRRVMLSAAAAEF
jgi:hypothetical protein